MRGNVTGTTNRLHPSTRQELFHCGNRTCCVLFNFSKGDFPTNGDVCILAYVEVNICPEGRGKTALAWSGLRALQLPAGELLPGCSMWPWTSHTAFPSCFPSSGRGRVVLGAVWGGCGGAWGQAVSSCAPIACQAGRPEMGAVCLAVGGGQPPAHPVTSWGEVSWLE